MLYLVFLELGHCLNFPLLRICGLGLEGEAPVLGIPLKLSGMLPNPDRLNLIQLP